MIPALYSFSCCSYDLIAHSCSAKTYSSTGLLWAQHAARHGRKHLGQPTKNHKIIFCGLESCRIVESSTSGNWLILSPRIDHLVGNSYCHTSCWCNVNTNHLTPGKLQRAHWETRCLRKEEGARHTEALARYISEAFMMGIQEGLQQKLGTYEDLCLVFTGTVLKHVENVILESYIYNIHML